MCKNPKPNTNLIFQKYSEPEQNRILIIKEREPNTNSKFWGLFQLYHNSDQATVILQCIWCYEVTNRDRRTLIAISLFCICDRSTWHSATVPTQSQVNPGSIALMPYWCYAINKNTDSLSLVHRRQVHYVIKHMVYQVWHFGNDEDIWHSMAVMQDNAGKLVPECLHSGFHWSWW